MTLQVAAIIGLLIFGVLGVLGALALFTSHTARRVNAALPPLGRFVEVGGTRIHYLERGEGPALLLIHGLGASLSVRSERKGLCPPMRSSSACASGRCASPWRSGSPSERRCRSASAAAGS